MNRGTQLTLGDTGCPEDRVVRIVNLHYAADSDDVREFFGDGYTIIDFVRAVNTKSKKNTIGYVLFATERERINAQMLSGRRILDREVKVVPAQSGFCVSSSGDKLLPIYRDTGSTTVSSKDTESYVPPSMGDAEAFPSLSVRGPVLVPTRKQNAHERALNNCILFMNNVGQGPEVNQTSFSLFFSGYTIVSVKRPLDPRTRAPNPTAFVMLGSAQERDDALFNLKDIPMQGQKVTLEAPKIFHNVTERGFISSSHEDVITFSSPPPEKFAHKSLKPKSDDLPEKHYPPNFSNTKLPILPCELEGETNDRKTVLSLLHARLGQYHKHAHHNHGGCMVDSNELKWGLSRAELSERHMSQQLTLLPMPSGVEGPGQIITVPPKTLPVISPSPPLSTRGPPPGIDITFDPREYSWNLCGNQSPAHQVVSEENWYGGLLALQQRERNN